MGSECCTCDCGRLEGVGILVCLSDSPSLHSSQFARGGGRIGHLAFCIVEGSIRVRSLSLTFRPQGILNRRGWDLGNQQPQNVVNRLKQGFRRLPTGHGQLMVYS